MSTPRRNPDSSVEATSPGQRYRSSSFSSDIPIGSPISSFGGHGSDYLSPMGVSGSPSSRPAMPHSASLPTIMGHPDESPFEPSRSRRSSLSSQHSTSTPTKQKSTYNHPYLIHSSSSAVLSRTNTSPVVNYTALPPSTLGHRTSKSMGFLRASQSVDDLRSPEKPGRDGSIAQSKGGSGYTSYTPPVRRKLVNRYSVSNLSDLAPRGEKDSIAEKESERKTGKLDMGVWEWKMGVKAETVPTRDLPPNPKLWNAHETAHYIAHCLSHGINPNPDSKTGITKLPSLVIQDITEWIKRGRVTGKGFLMGGEGSWASSSKPPPFMDVLLSLSRNLRRASLKGNIAGISWQTPSASDQANAGATSSVIHNRDTSVLEEANEDDDDEEEEDAVRSSSNVKRLALDFDTRSISSMSTAGSEIGKDDTFERARPRSGRTFSTNSQQSQRSRDDIAEKAKRFERGLAEIEKQPGHDLKANFGHLVDTVRDDANRAPWDSAVAEGGSRPGSMSRVLAALSIEDLPAVKAGREPAAIGLGIFDGPSVPVHSEMPGHDQVEEEHKTPAFQQSPIISPPPAYTSPQFGTAPAEINHSDALRGSDPRTVDQSRPPSTISTKQLSYGLLASSEDSSNVLKPRLPTSVNRRATTATDSSGQSAETPPEPDADDPRDMGRRVTLRPARISSAVYTPTKRIPTGSRPDLDAERSGSVTPGMPHPAEQLLSQAQVTIDELQERLRSTKSQVARLESALRESQQRKPVPEVVADQHMDIPPQSNHQALAILYGGLAGLCMSVLVLKTFGRRAGSF